jgi:hypothetical protein
MRLKKEAKYLCNRIHQFVLENIFKQGKGITNSYFRKFTHFDKSKKAGLEGRKNTQSQEDQLKCCYYDPGKKW